MVAGSGRNMAKTLRENSSAGKKSLQFHLSVVRIGSSLTGILMAALVYIGSIHLHKETSKNSFQKNKEAQKIWRMIYLVVSFAHCVLFYNFFHFCTPNNLFFLY